MGPLAQLVEQRTFNPLVIGSNPIRPTNKPIDYLVEAFEMNPNQLIPTIINCNTSFKIGTILIKKLK